MANSAEYYKRIGNEIISIVGEDNIISITHCVSRLRMIVKDYKAINKDKIEAVDEVKGVFYTGGQYQIILGTGIVNKVYDQIIDQYDLSETSKEEMTQENTGKLQRGIRLLADVFIPIIPILGATGLFLGLKGVIFNASVLNVLGMTPAMVPQWLTTMVSVLTDTAFGFLPAFICWSAFKKFKGTPVIGFLIGLMLVSPALPNAYEVASGAAKPITVGFAHLVGYQGSILTALITGILGAGLEKKLRKVMPNSMDLIFTPFIVIFIMIILALFGFGPIVHALETGIVHAVEFFIHLPFGIGGFIIGVLYPLCVMTGLHHMYIMIETSLLASTGFNPLITVCAMYGFANAAVCLALSLRNKKASGKAAGVSATVTQMLGVSEPALFGVVLPSGTKAIGTMLLCSGIGGGILSFLNIKANSYGLAVLLSPIMYIYQWNQVVTYLLVGVVVFVLAFILTNLFAIPSTKTDKQTKELSALEAGSQAGILVEANSEQTQTALYTPVAGIILDLAKVNDVVFSKKMMGDGFAVQPADGKIVSPVKGKITMIAPTKHAIGVTTDEGLEVLIHMGIDTVSLDGKPFNINVVEGQYVQIGEELGQMDLNYIKEKDKDTTVMVVMTNMKDRVSSWTLSQSSSSNLEMA